MSPPRIDIRRHFIAAGFTGRSLLEDGSTGDFLNGLLHRDDGEPARTHPNGTRWHYQHGMLHRVGGPAIEGNGHEEYWHRGRPCLAHEPVEATAGKRNDTMPRLLASRPEI